MKSSTPKFLVFFCLACIVGSYESKAQEYIFNHLSSRDGLLSNNVLSLYQDRKGFLWIGTDAGLQRYDGYHFININAKNVAGPVHQILEDAEGIVWLRCGKTVGVFDLVRTSFTPVPFAEGTKEYDNGLFRLKLNGDKKLFVAVQGVGAFYLNTDRTAFSKAAAPFSSPPGWIFSDAIYDAAQKRYWLYGRSGLGYYDAGDSRFHACAKTAAHPLLTNVNFSTDIFNFYIDKKRRYWIAKWSAKTNAPEYYCYDEAKKAYTIDTAGLYSAGNSAYYEIHRFTEFNDTTVLVYGLNCMSMTENGVFTSFRSPQYTPYSLQFDVVNDVLEDREHILWVATDDGLYNTMANISSSRHKMIGQQSGRSVINCLLQDEAKNIWLGMWDRSLIVLDSALEKNKVLSGMFEKRPEPQVKMTWALHQHSRSKKVWIGCQDGVLAMYDPATGRLTVLKPPEFERRTVRQIVEDTEGGLWFGLQSGRLFYCPPTGKEARFKEVHRFGGFISKLRFDNTGLLWIGVSKKRLYAMNVKQQAIVRTFDNNDSSVSENYISDILPVNDSTLLLASDRLELLNPLTRRSRYIAWYNKAPLGRIYSLQKGGGDEYWFSAASGMYRYNLHSGNLVKYSQWDGLVTVFNNSFVLEQSLTLRNGELVFAGNQNFVLFDPARYKSATVLPDAQLTSFQLFNNYLPVDSITGLRSINLDHNQNSFTLDFAALSFTQLEKLTYEYKLEGIDKEWTAVNLPQPVKYALLPPGGYTFIVRVKNSEGVYSKRALRLTLVVLPPFWKTYWFMALLVLAVGSFLYYLHHLRLKRLLHVESVRSRLARDLHDDMGSTLSTINILSNMAMQQKDLDERMSKTFMAKISESTAQMMDSMDDIIWSINPLNDSMGKVLSRMKQVAGHVLEPQGIEYGFHADEAVKGLSFTVEWRREIFLIYKEAINNIVKYAQCTKVDVSLKKEKNLFLLTITDNGVGFETRDRKEALPTRGNGFVNMKKRAEAVHGRLQISAAHNLGTQIILAVPLV